MDDERANELLDHRKIIIEARKQGQVSADRAVLTLAGGGLGVSFAFVGHFIHGIPCDKWLLFATWMLWALSLTLALINYLVSDIAHGRAIDEIDNEIEKVYGEDTTIKNENDSKLESIRNVIHKTYKPFNAFITAANYAGAVLFIVGTFSLGIFVFINYSHYGTVNKESNEVKTMATEKGKSGGSKGGKSDDKVSTNRQDSDRRIEIGKVIGTTRATSVPTPPPPKPKKK